MSIDRFRIHTAHRGAAVFSAEDLRCNMKFDLIHCARFQSTCGKFSAAFQQQKNNIFFSQTGEQFVPILFRICSDSFVSFRNGLRVTSGRCNYGWRGNIETGSSPS